MLQGYPSDILIEILVLLRLQDVIVFLSVSLQLCSEQATNTRTRHLFLTIVDGEPCIFAAANGHYTIYRCLLDALHHGQATGLEDRAFVDDTAFKRTTSVFIPNNPLTYYPPYNLFSGTVRIDVQWTFQGHNVMFNVYVGDENRTSCAHIYFMPTASLYPPTSPQAGKPIIVEKKLEGKIYHHDSDFSPYLVASTQSGNYKAVIVVEDVPEPRSRAALHLLRFEGDLESPSVQDRPLELPSSIDLLKIYSIAIDDRRGVIYLSHESGQLFTIPYI